MASLKYGCVTPNAKGREYPVAASQFFPHEGGAFVYLDGSGHILFGLTATATLFGYAIVPAGVGVGAAGSTYWKSSATAGADKMFVITDIDAEFVVPGNATVTAAMAGNAADLVGVNDGAAAQKVATATSTYDVLLIQGRAMDIGAGYATTDALVKRNPAKVQADT